MPNLDGDFWGDIWEKYNLWYNKEVVKNMCPECACGGEVEWPDQMDMIECLVTDALIEEE